MALHALIFPAFTSMRDKPHDVDAEMKVTKQNTDVIMYISSDKVNIGKMRVSNTVVTKLIQTKDTKRKRLHIARL